MLPGNILESPDREISNEIFDLKCELKTEFIAVTKNSKKLILNREGIKK